jgi:putative ABC transport system ATP-binding protein
LQIDHRLTFKVDTLSGGEMQRLAIARALINDPDIIIADEPTAHLDTELAKDILEIFAQLKTEGKTLIIASHDPLVENHPMVDTVFCMRDGQLGEPDVC